MSRYKNTLVRFLKLEFHNQPWREVEVKVLKVSVEEEVIGRERADFMIARVAVDLENVFTVRVPEGFWSVVKAGQNLPVKCRISKNDINRREAYFVRTGLDELRRQKLERSNIMSLS